MKELELQKFLKANPYDWARKLMSPPYNLKITNKGELVQFKYDQIKSDFSNPIVQECRGIILWEDNWDEIVCRPFSKFFNYGEENAEKIDWESAEIYEKKDGSLIKIYFWDGEWKIATNGTIEASDATLQFPPNEAMETFADLFYYTLSLYVERKEDFFNILNPNYSYMCEIATPVNKVIISHDDYYLFFITAKHNSTGKEVRDAALPIDNIPSYSFGSMEDVVKMAEKLSYDQEGYVVVDKYNNRIKVKSPLYLKLHQLKGEDTPSKRRIFDLVLAGEEGEFLTYFPEYTEIFNKIKYGLNRYMEEVEADARELFNTDYDTRKQFALDAKKTILPGFMFALLDDRVGHLTLHDYISNMTQKNKDSIINMITRREK